MYANQYIELLLSSLTTLMHWPETLALHFVPCCRDKTPNAPPLPAAARLQGMHADGKWTANPTYTTQRRSGVLPNVGNLHNMPQSGPSVPLMRGQPMARLRATQSLSSILPPQPAPHHGHVSRAKNHPQHGMPWILRRQKECPKRVTRARCGK
jgi:hypothetical protein